MPELGGVPYIKKCNRCGNPMQAITQRAGYEFCKPCLGLERERPPALAEQGENTFVSTEKQAAQPPTEILRNVEDELWISVYKASLNARDPAKKATKAVKDFRAFKEKEGKQ